jgi:hypothetical protein
MAANETHQDVLAVTHKTIEPIGPLFGDCRLFLIDDAFTHVAALPTIHAMRHITTTLQGSIQFENTSKLLM